MKMVWNVLGSVAALLVAAPVASAHLLECDKTVNGETLLEASTFPLTLNYSLTVRNIHPTSASEVLEASDPLLDDLGFGGFNTPFTLPLGAEETKTFKVELKDLDACEKLADDDGSKDAFIDNTFHVRWDSGSSSCSARVVCVPPDQATGKRMTGGGSVFGTGKNRVTHGFELRCDASDPRQNLEVNFQGNKFHLLDLTTATCTDDPAIDEGNPVAGFDTFVGTGTGRYNGVDGATISFKFTDAGEPGKDDTAQMVITDASNNVVLNVSGKLNFGNHQAHP
jgi:hypothetical protein